MTEPDAGSDLLRDRHARRGAGRALAASRAEDLDHLGAGRRLLHGLRAHGRRRTLERLPGRAGRRRASRSAAPSRRWASARRSPREVSSTTSPATCTARRAAARAPSYLREILAEIRVDDRGARAGRGARRLRGRPAPTPRERAAVRQAHRRASRRCRPTWPRWRTDLEAARRLTALGRLAQRAGAARTTREASMAKLFASEAALPRLRPRRAGPGELRLRDGVPGRALPARRALHADRRRHLRDPARQHREGAR